MNLSALILLKHKQNTKEQKGKKTEKTTKRTFFSFFSFKKKKNIERKKESKVPVSKVLKTDEKLNFSEIETLAKNKSTPIRSRKISMWKIFVFIPLFFLLIKGVVYLLVSQGVIGHKATISPLPSSSVAQNSKNIYNPHKNTKQTKLKKPNNSFTDIPFQDLSSQNAQKYGTPVIKQSQQPTQTTISPKHLFQVYCGANKNKIAKNINFLISNKYAFSYLSKKYRKGDSLVGLGRKDLRVDLVYPIDGGKRAVDIKDKRGNICTVVVPWDKGLQIKIFYNAIDVKEDETQNIQTFLVGDTFNHVTLTKIKITNGVKTVFFKTASNKIIKFTQKQNKAK